MASRHEAFEKAARIGYTAKGVVYGVVGILAFRTAIGAGGGTTGAGGALREIGQQPYGQSLLTLTGLGLLGYVVWRALQAFADAESEGTDAKGLVKRIAFAVSGIVYILLAIQALAIAWGPTGGGGGRGATGWTAELMSQPFGRWLVALVGAIFIAVAVNHFIRAGRASFMKSYETGGMSPRQVQWARRIGRFGIAARGVTFAIIGVLLIEAARSADPEEARGLAGALSTLLEQPYGPWLLGLVAVGFIAYGVYCFSRAKYRRIDAGDTPAHARAATR